MKKMMGIAFGGAVVIGATSFVSTIFAERPTVAQHAVTTSQTVAKEHHQ